MLYPIELRVLSRIKAKRSARKVEFGICRAANNVTMARSSGPSTLMQLGVKSQILAICSVTS